MFLRPRARIILLIILILSLPWLLYALWLADYYNEPTYDPPPPPQTLSRTDLSYTNCDDAVTLVTDPPAQPVDEPGQRVIDAGQAKGIADAALRRALDLPAEQDPEYVYGPVLLRATLPDRDERLVWARLWSVLPYSTDQDTSILYLDAASGEPVVLYTDLTGLDPAFGAECTYYGLDSMEFVTPEVMLMGVAVWEIILIVLMALVALVVTGIRTLRNRNRPTRPE